MKELPEQILAALRSPPSGDRDELLLDLLQRCEEFIDGKDFHTAALTVACSSTSSIQTMERAIRAIQPSIDTAKTIVEATSTSGDKRTAAALGQIVISGTKEASEWAARHPLCPLEYRTVSAMR